MDVSAFFCPGFAAVYLKEWTWLHHAMCLEVRFVASRCSVLGAGLRPFDNRVVIISKQGICIQTKNCNITKFPNPAEYQGDVPQDFRCRRGARGPWEALLVPWIVDS